MKTVSNADRLGVLERAVSDVGFWNWWTANLPESFQVEFNHTQLLMPQKPSDKAPSSKIALRFRSPRLVAFLNMAPRVRKTWPEQLHKDKLDPISLAFEDFTLTSPSVCKKIFNNAVSVRTLVGDAKKPQMPKRGEAFVALANASFGLIVIAESMKLFTFQGELRPTSILAANRRWWLYWRRYWKRIDTKNPLPQDRTCECVIPADTD